MDEEKEGGQKKNDTVKFLAIGGGVILVIFLASQATSGASTSGTAPQSASSAPSDAAVQAAATEYGSQLSYQSQVLQAGSQLQAAALAAIPQLQTNDLNYKLGTQSIAAQEAENANNNATTLAGEGIQATLQNDANYLSAGVSEQTIAAQLQAQEAALQEQLGVVQTQTAGSVAINQGQQQTQQVISNNQKTVSQTQSNNQTISNGIGGLFGAIGSIFGL